MGNAEMSGVSNACASHVVRDALSPLARTHPRRPDAPASLLREVLATRARAAGSSLRELVTALGGTERDVSVLDEEPGSSAHLGRPFIEACARCLRLPPVAVKCLAGELVLADFVMPGSVPGGLNEALAQVGCSSLLACLLPRGVHALDDETQRFVLRCLEEASGQVLLKPIYALSELRAAMQAAMSVDDELGRR